MQTSYRRLATTTPSRSASLTHSPSPVSSRFPRSSSSTSIASTNTQSTLSSSSTPQTSASTTAVLATVTVTARPTRTMSITAASRSPSVLPVPVVAAHTHSHSHSHSHSQAAAELAMSSLYTRAELHTIAESLLASVAAHSSTTSMLSQSPARSPLTLPALPALGPNSGAGPARPSAARRFEGKESTRRQSHDLRAMMEQHHQPPQYQHLPTEGERDRRGRDKQVKGLKK